MRNKAYITTALVAAAGFALAMPVFAQTAAPQGRPAMFDFATLDANGDGKVTLDEITAARDAEAKALDANGDGKIDAAELLAYRTAGLEARIKAEIAALDTDGDGALSAAELAGHRVVRATPALSQAMFDRIDTDKDGAISQAEFDAAKTKLRQFGQNQRGQAQHGMNQQGNGGRNQGTMGKGQPDHRMQGDMQGGNRGDQGNQRGWMPFWHR